MERKNGTNQKCQRLLAKYVRNTGTERELFSDRYCTYLAGLCVGGCDTVTGNNSERQERSGQNGFYEGGWGEGEQDTVMPWGQTIHCIAVN